MEDLMKLLIFLCLVFWGKVSAVPIQTHKPGGIEHIVIIDKTHPTPPQVVEVLQRLELNEGHPDVRHVYNNSAFTGFAASMKTHCLGLLANMSDVSMVEQAASVQRATAQKRQNSLAYRTRSNAPWGLQRISTSSAVSGSASALDFTYSFTSTALGEGAHVYILDTGIYTEHNVFDGRASMVWSYDGNNTDLDGHGTHVAGTAAGDFTGVASNANIYGVRALDSDGGGWSSNVVAGIDFIVRAHDAAKANHSTFRGSVMSMSLASGGPVQSINNAIEAAVQAGVHAVVAAGNDNQDACQSSPASSGGTAGPAITVGSVGMTNGRSSFSNYGDCVDVYAPGEDVISAWVGGPDMINMLSGTSMATPHVTGIVAYAMANSTLANNPGLMKQWVRATALQQSDGSFLANNGARAGSDEGMLGFSKFAPRPNFTSVRPATQTGPATKVKRTFPGPDPLIDCRREAQLHQDKWYLRGGWPCRARRRTGRRSSMLSHH